MVMYQKQTKRMDRSEFGPIGAKGSPVPQGGVIPFSRLTPHMEEYYPTVVINCLLSILNDESLAEHHHFAMAGGRRDDQPTGEWGSDNRRGRHLKRKVLGRILSQQQIFVVLHTAHLL